jgi:hypothetical protein
MSRMKVWAYVIHESEYIQSSNLEIDVVWAKAPKLFGLSHAHGPRGFKVSCDGREGTDQIAEVKLETLGSER